MGSTANRASKPAPASVIGKAGPAERGAGTASSRPPTRKDAPVATMASSPGTATAPTSVIVAKADPATTAAPAPAAAASGSARGGGQPDEQAEPEERQHDDRQRASPGASAQRLDGDDDHRGGPDRHQRREPDRGQRDGREVARLERGGQHGQQPDAAQGGTTVAGRTEEWTGSPRLMSAMAATATRTSRPPSAEPVGGDGERGQSRLTAEQTAEEAAGAPGDAGENEQGDTGATAGRGGRGGDEEGHGSLLRRSCARRRRGIRARTRTVKSGTTNVGTVRVPLYRAGGGVAVRNRVTSRTVARGRPRREGHLLDVDLWQFHRRPQVCIP